MYLDLAAVEADSDLLAERKPVEAFAIGKFVVTVVKSFRY